MVFLLVCLLASPLVFPPASLAANQQEFLLGSQVASLQECLPVSPAVSQVASLLVCLLASPLVFPAASLAANQQEFLLCLPLQYRRLYPFAQLGLYFKSVPLITVCLHVV